MGHLSSEDAVMVEPLREAVLRAIAQGDASWEGLSVQMGWFNGGKGDIRRLQRTLGVKPMGNGYTNRRLKYETAVKLVRLLGLDPVDYDV